MRTPTLKHCLIVALCCTTSVALAQNPFVGTWKVDFSKSHVTGQTFSFTAEGNGQVKMTEGAESYTFTPNGSETHDGVGDMVKWQKMDNHNWKSFTQAGNTVITDTYTLSGDEKTLTDSVSGTRPNGQQIDEKVSFSRVTPGKGFFGKWKSTNMENNSPTTAKIDANGDNGIVWHIPEIKAYVKLNFDGTEATPVGPTVPKGLTLSAKKIGPRSFALTEKVNGKVIFRGRYTVSADGNTMTEVGGSPGESAPVKVVFQKS